MVEVAAHVEPAGSTGRAQQRDEQPPGRSTPRADALRVELPIGGVGTHEADGALGVLERGAGFRVGTGVWDAVFEQRAGDAGAREPVADLGAFEVHGEDVVAAAGKDDDGCTCVFAHGLVERESRGGDGAEAYEWVAGNEVIFGGGGVGFRDGCRLGVRTPGRAVGPKGESFVARGWRPAWCLCGEGRCDCGEQEQAEGDVHRVGDPDVAVVSR